MNISLRSVAQNCLGVTGSFSVTRDVYGYIFRDNTGRVFGNIGSDTLPASGQPTTRSLRQLIDQIEGNSVNLTMFLVAHENDFSGLVTRADVVRIQYAIQVTRDVYAQAGIGIRRIYWRLIGMDSVGNYATITNKAEAEDLTDDFTGPNADSLDVFWVQEILNAGGWCNTDGPCNKNKGGEMTGVVIELSMSSSRFAGILLAHEVGHYLGLPGATDGIANLMGSDVNNNGIDEINGNSTGITNGQASDMLEHCSILDPC